MEINLLWYKYKNIKIGVIKILYSLPFVQTLKRHLFLILFSKMYSFEVCITRMKIVNFGFN